MNQFILVGRIVEILSKDSDIITIATTRPYKNEYGDYETDVIDIIIKDSMANTTAEYCKKGDIIGVRGSVSTKNINNIRQTILVANKISFLSARKDN